MSDYMRRAFEAHLWKLAITVFQRLSDFSQFNAFVYAIQNVRNGGKFKTVAGSIVLDGTRLSFILFLAVALNSLFRFGVINGPESAVTKHSISVTQFLENSFTVNAKTH